MMASNLVSKRSSRWCFYVALFVITIFLSLLQANLVVADQPVIMAMRSGWNYDQNSAVKGGRCEEIYVVHEGETLHSISDKCGDPFILEQNPHVQESDDVFPGLVIKISSLQLTNSRKFLM